MRSNIFEREISFEGVAFIILNDSGGDFLSKKLILFDIDGTLLDHEKKLPVSTKEAIKSLQNMGHEVAIATGRPPYFFKELREELGIDTFVCFNGQYVEVANEVIFKNPIDQEKLSKLLSFSSLHEHPLVFMGAETMKSSIDYHIDIEDSFVALDVGVTHPKANPNYFNETEIYQVLLYCNKEEESLYLDYMPGLKYVRWHVNALDVLPLGGSKANGIEKLIELKGYTIDQVYAFGDYYNDLEMLAYVGHGVAMGNSPEEVKNAARYVTKDVDDDGIAYGLKMVGLL